MTTFDTTTLRRPVLLVLACAAIGVASGCMSCTSERWAQNAPTLRGETPPSRAVHLGAWGEREPEDQRD